MLPILFQEMINKSLSENMAILNDDNLQKIEVIKDLRSENKDRGSKIEELTQKIEELSRDKIALQDELVKLKNDRAQASHQEMFEQHLNGGEKGPVKLVQFSEWGVGFQYIQQYGNVVMCATREKHIVLYTGSNTVSGPHHVIQINDMRGRQIQRAFKECNANGPQYLTRHIISTTHKGKSFLVVNCTCCEQIKIYDAASLNTVAGRHNVLADGLCTGQNGAIIYLDADSYELQMLKLVPSRGHLNNCGPLLKHSPTHKGAGSILFTYDAQSDVFVITDREPGHHTLIAYTRCNDKSSAYPYRKSWNIGPNVNGQTIDVTDICSDNLGLIYVADGENNRIIVLESVTGNVLPTVFDPPLRQMFCQVLGMTYCDASDTLVVRHADVMGSLVITCFNIPMRMSKHTNIKPTSSKSQNQSRCNKKAVSSSGELGGRQGVGSGGGSEQFPIASALETDPYNYFHKEQINQTLPQGPAQNYQNSGIQETWRHHEANGQFPMGHEVTSASQRDPYMFEYGDEWDRQTVPRYNNRVPPSQGRNEQFPLLYARADSAYQFGYGDQQYKQFSPFSS